MEETSTLPADHPGLTKSYLFSCADAARLGTIESLAKTSKLSKGQTLFFQDDPGDALYVVRSGTLEVSVIASSGKKLSLNLMRAGDVIGEIAALDGGPRTATVTAVQDAVLFCVERSQLVKLLRRDPQLALDLIHILCGRLRWISQQVEDLALLNIEGRLASRLMILVHKFSDASGHLNLSQSELADFLGITRETTNKVLQGWRSRGIVEISRGSISVRDRHALAEIAEPIGQ